jgi:hypothetical protein
LIENGLINRICRLSNLLWILVEDDKREIIIYRRFYYQEQKKRFGERKSKNKLEIPLSAQVLP